MKIQYDEYNIVCSIIIEETDQSYKNIRDQIYDGQFINETLLPNLMSELKSNETFGFNDFAAGEDEFNVGINLFDTCIDIRIVKSSAGPDIVEELTRACSENDIENEYVLDDDNNLIESNDCDESYETMEVIELAASAFWFETLDEIIHVSKLLTANYNVFKDDDEYGIIYRRENTTDEIIFSEYAYETEFVENENELIYFMEHHEPITNTNMLKGIA